MWHYRHFYEPREVTAGSIMPRYTWLFRDKMDYRSLPKKMEVMQFLGVPYTTDEIKNGVANAKAQAAAITTTLVSSGVPEAIVDKEVISLIAYMQRLGMDIKQSVPDVAETEEVK
jgi:cytochrome c oxidase cbb3-type subunit I/II